MAIIEKSIFGKISGKLGNMLVYERKGKTIIKSFPAKISKPPSAKQLYHRAAFKVGQQFLTPLRAELEFGFAKSNPVQSHGISRALSVVLKTAILNEEGKPVLYPEKVKISEGDLLGLESPHAQWVGENLLEITWFPNSFMGHAKDADQLFVIAYDPETDRKWSVLKGNYRKSGLQHIQFPWSSDLHGRFYIYISLFRENRGLLEFSDSFCVGRI